MNNPVTDEEFVSQLAERIAPLEIEKVTSKEITNMILAMAEEKGYMDGPGLATYLKTPSGQAFYTESLRLEREARKFPAEFKVLTARERKRVINEFEEIMGRPPTLAEREELYTEGLKLKREVVLV